MARKSQKQDALKRIDDQIQALQRKRQDLQRLFAKWKAAEALSNESVREVIEVWRFKLRIGLPIEPIADERRSLETFFSSEIIACADAELETRVSQLAARRQIEIFDEFNRCLREVDTLVEEMKEIRVTLNQQEKPTWQMAWNTRNKFLRVGLGTVLIGLDAPTANWISIIPGTVIILQAIEFPIN